MTTGLGRAVLWLQPYLVHKKRRSAAKRIVRFFDTAHLKGQKNGRGTPAECTVTCDPGQLNMTRRVTARINNSPRQHSHHSSPHTQTLRAQLTGTEIHPFKSPQKSQNCGPVLCSKKAFRVTCTNKRTEVITAEILSRKTSECDFVSMNCEAYWLVRPIVFVRAWINWAFRNSTNGQGL